MSIKLINGKPEGNCERCGKWSDFLWTMGNSTKKVVCYICDKCHEKWAKYCIPKLEKQNLRGQARIDWLDKELKEFLKSGREVVKFT